MSASEILVLSRVPKLVLATVKKFSAAFKSDLALANWVVHPSKVVSASLLAASASLMAPYLKVNSSSQVFRFSSASSVWAIYSSLIPFSNSFKRSVMAFIGPFVLIWASIWTMRPAMDLPLMGMGNLSIKDAALAAANKTTQNKANFIEFGNLYIFLFGF